MKSRKWLSLALIIALLAMGTGYAYWSQNLTAVATLSTGELKVIVEDLAVDTKISGLEVLASNGQPLNGYQYGFIGSDYFSNLSMRHSPSEYQNETGELLTFAEDPNFPGFDLDMFVPDSRESVTLRLNKAYPGLRTYFTVNYKNVGTVPVKLSGTTYDVDTEKVNFIGRLGSANEALANYLLAEGLVSFTIDPNSATQPHNQVLYCNDQSVINIVMTVSPDIEEVYTIDGQDYQTENAEIVFDLSLVAVQHTD